MSASSVWVQLYYEGENEPKGSPEQIYESDLKEGRDWNVASFKGMVKEKRRDKSLSAIAMPQILPCISQTQSHLFLNRLLLERTRH